jgi:membrane protein DedA with SNARE-associated domain
VGHGFSHFLTLYGLFALFLLAFVKATGLPIPIPIDLVVLGAATGSASGKLVFWQAFSVLLLAMCLGGMIQFGLVRGPGRALVHRFGRSVGLTTERLEVACQRVDDVGFMGIGAAVVTPGIRTAAIPACGLTGIPARTFALGLTVGTTVFLAVQFFLGYAGVKLVMKFWKTEPVVGLLIALGLVVLLIWMVVRHRTRHLPRLQRGGEHELRSSLCPLCRLAGMLEMATGKARGGAARGAARLMAQSQSGSMESSISNGKGLR